MAISKLCKRTRRLRTFFSTVLLISLVQLLVGQSAAMGLSSTDLNSINLGTEWYKAVTITGCATTVSTSLSGNDRIEQAYNYFIAKGLTAPQAAGIVGNFKWESGVDPTKAGGDGDTMAPTDTWGVAQWTRASGRLTNLEKFAEQNNVKIYELSTQLDFAWQELSNGPVLAELKQTSSVAGAAKVIFDQYEIPLDDTLSDRQKMANEIYQQYGSNGVSITTPQNNFGGCSSVGPGQNTQYIDGFTVYSQYDPQWANDPYGSSTIAESGCGPSAMAMIITALKDQQITPDLTASYAGSQGLYIPGSGSSWNIAPVLAQHWGLKASPIGANVARISAALQSGGLVIASGQGPLPFTSGGHYIVIRAVTADGKWKIGDSAHSDTSSQSWDPQQLIASMNDGSVYAITK